MLKKSKKRKISWIMIISFFTLLFNGILPLSHQIVKADTLPALFSSKDIGGAAGGTTSFDPETKSFTVSGSGNDLDKTATGTDQFQFAYTKVSGDFTFTGRLKTFTNTGGGKYPKAGLMIRSDDTSGNAYYIADIVQGTSLTPRSSYRFGNNVAGGGNLTVANPPTLAGPVYFKIVKTGVKYDLYLSNCPISSNDTAALSKSETSALGLNASDISYIGLAVCGNDTSGSNAKFASAVFDQVKIVKSDNTVVYDSEAGAASSLTTIFVDGSQPTDAAQNRYKTVSEAVAAAPTVSDEKSRVVIQIADGTYREQVIVDKPYITFKSASGDASKVILTWYYGVGYDYNNVGTNGYYSSNVDWSADSTWTGLTKHKAGDTISTVTYYDKSGVLHNNETVTGGILGKPAQWGCATKLTNQAKYFIADNVTFENSYDFYVPKEEINAGVVPEPQATMKPDRVSLGAGSVEVEKNSYVERAAALSTDSDNTIIKNCTIRSKQDTLYIGTNRIYFDHCTIMGGTDYIFGGATAVFNQCNLVFAGNSDNTNTGIVTAGSHKTTTQYGYLFWNCTVDYRLKDKVPTPGAFGRPWSDPLGAQVTFYNTTVKKVNGVQVISDIGWQDMTTKMNEARFYEYGTMDESVNPVDISKRPKNALASMGIVLDKWQILEFNPRNYLKGSDGWDPMDFAKNYTGIDEVLNSTSINTSSSGDTISLPCAPAGYEFSWASDSKYAVVSDDKSSITVIRPAYGEPAINATVTLYAKNSNTGFGDKKSISFQIQPKATADNTFSVSGTIAMKSAATSDVSVQIIFRQSGVAVKTQTCAIPAGQISMNYTAKYLPAGTYDVVVETPSGYKLTSDVVAEVSGNTGETKTINVGVGKLATYTVKTTEFTEPWATAIQTASATGFSMGKFTANGTENANLGAGNVVYKFTKDAGVTIPANVGGSWDLLAAVKANGNTLNNADTLQFSYDFLMENVNYLPSNYSYFDLATGTSNAGQGAADNTRFLRWGVYKGWSQFNMFGANNVRVNGDNTQFTKNDMMANKWYHIVANIDLKNKIITTTLYNRDANKILNSKAFSMASPDSTGNNPAYPTAADITKALNFNVYMDSSSTANKMEYYFDNLELQYNDYDTSNVVQIPAAPENVVATSGDKSATLTWDTAINATSYTVKQSNSAAGPFTKVDSAVITSENGKVQAKISNLENDKTFYYVVTASNGSGESSSSAVVGVTPKATITTVDPPSDIIVTQGDSVALPKAVTVHYSDSSSQSVAVIWNGTVDTNTVGTQTIQGNVSGYSGIVSVKVNVIAIAKEFTVNSTFNLSSLSPGKMLNVLTTVTNNKSSNQSVLAVLKLYDENGKVLNISYVSKDIPIGSTERLNTGFKLPANVTGCTAKVFLLDGTNLGTTTMKALSEIVTLK